MIHDSRRAPETSPSPNILYRKSAWPAFQAPASTIIHRMVRRRCASPFVKKKNREPRRKNGSQNSVFDSIRLSAGRASLHRSRQPERSSSTKRCKRNSGSERGLVPLPDVESRTSRALQSTYPKSFQKELDEEQGTTDFS